jgi:hypothetical protein
MAAGAEKYWRDPSDSAQTPLRSLCSRQAPALMGAPDDKHAINLYCRRDRFYPRSTEAAEINAAGNPLVCLERNSSRKETAVVEH